MGKTYCILVDVGSEHVIEHLVVYRQLDGSLIGIAGSWDCGPFSTPYEACQWLTRTLVADSRYSVG